MPTDLIKKITPGNSSPQKPKNEEKLSGDPEKHHRFFDNLSIRDLSGQEKQEVAEMIIDGLNTGVEYRAQMLLSAVIATLGLLINSTPVVIGAMLIAPILRPIQGMAFATITGSHSLFMRSLGLLMTSVLGSAVVAALITLSIPFAQPTAEILARTHPTLIDLFIALASGVIAFLALGYKKISVGIAGVAMAAALVPPLAVIGIGAAFGDISIARGSFLLFATNLIAIILVGVVVLILFGFRPNAKKNYRKSLGRMFSIIILLVLLCVPLMQSFVNISQDLNTKNIITSQTNDYIQTIDPRIKISSSSYKSSPDSGKGMDIMLQLQVPQSLSITESQKIELTELLAQELQTSVNLQFTIIPIISVEKPQEKGPTAKETLDQAVTSYFQEQESLMRLLSSTYIESSQVYLLTLYAPAEIDIKQAQESITTMLNGTEVVISDTIYDRRQQKILQTQDAADIDTKIVNIRQQFNRSITTGMQLDDISWAADQDLLTLSIISYLSHEQTAVILSERKDNLTEDEERSDTQVDAIIQYYDRWTIGANREDEDNNGVNASELEVINQE